MHFEWDERKNGANKRKHGISFELAVEVFRDPFCITTFEMFPNVAEAAASFSVARVEAVAEEASPQPATA